MEPLISIIIPVYNVKKYLRQCLDSVIHQTYKNIEIIIVDDGSTDNSGKMCDEYKDSNIHIYHKDNGGLSDARNYGLDRSHGKYIFFLDSDDYIENNTIELLYKYLLQYHADIVVSNYYYLYSDHKDISSNITEIKEYNTKESIHALLENKEIKNFAWGKLYKRELLDSIYFPKGKLFEDIYWTHLIFHNSHKVIFIPEPLVNYRQREDSISYTFNINKLDILEGYKVRKEFIKEYYPEYTSIINKTVSQLILSLYIESKRNKYRNNMIVDRLKTYAQEVLKEYDDKDLNTFIKSPYEYYLKYYLRKLVNR